MGLFHFAAQLPDQIDLFSYLTDRFGRKKLFLITLAVYLVFSFFTAFSWNFWSFAFFRFMAGAGIGGEYSAIYSAVDEIIPARFRGQVALAISGSYWIGALMGSVLSIFLLNPNVIDQTIGWRVAFWLGAGLGVGVLLIRRFVPESLNAATQTLMWLRLRLPQSEGVSRSVLTSEGRSVLRSTGLFARLSA